MTHHTDMLGQHPTPVNVAALPRVSFQGELGAFSELAIQKHWKGRAIAVPSERFEDAIARIADGTADFSVIPVENAIAGPVQAALTALGVAGSHVQSVGEVSVDIELCLMAPAGASLTEVRAVYSHPMALAQCRQFVSGHPWLSARRHADTAGAARDIAQRRDLSVAAIAGAPAAERYGLEILARAIQDAPGNWTRFVVIGRV